MYVFSFDYPPLSGGIARLCSELASELERRHELRGVLTMGSMLPPSVGHPSSRIPRTRPFSELQALRFLACRPDHRPVLCGRWWPEGAISVAARRGKTVVLAHGAELLNTRNVRGSLRAPLRRWVLEHASLVVANSHFTAHLVQQCAPKARCIALPLAVDAQRFSPGDPQVSRQRLGLPSKSKIIATVARIHAFKGHLTVLRALAMLEPRQRDQLQYAVVGTGPYAQELKEQAAALGLAAHVKFLGHIPDEALPDVYRAADLHALLTEQTLGDVEGFGLASLEAQASGTPALACSAGGASDAVVVGGGGWLVPPADAHAVAEHLRTLVDEPKKYREAGRRGRERVLESCTWQLYAEALLAMISSTPDPGEVA